MDRDQPLHSTANISMVARDWAPSLLDYARTGRAAYAPREASAFATVGSPPPPPPPSGGLTAVYHRPPHTTSTRFSQPGEFCG
jgi:hypothetical protein